MLSKFFNSLKPKEYSVQVLRDDTSQSAVKRIKRTRTAAPYKKIAALTLALAFAGGGLASATAASAVTADQAQANIFADMICVKADEDNSGAWNGGDNLYGIIGGRSVFSMDGIGKNTVPSDAAYQGKRGTWGEGVGAPDGGQHLTAYEKYGVGYPKYDAWKPVFTDKEITIKQVDTKRGYSDEDGKLPVRGGNKMEAGASPLTTSNFGSCTAVLPAASAAISNMIATMPRFIMAASVELFSTAYGSSISDKHSVLSDIGKSIDRFITQPGGLKDSLFIPFMLPLILIGAIWVGYVGIVKRAAMQAVQSTAWMILAIAFGTIFLAQPTLISSYMDSTVASVQRVINESVTSSSQATDMCNLDRSKDKRATIRETKCTLWHSTIYTPWVAGQFGQGANSSTAPGSFLTQGAGRHVLGQNGYEVYYGSKNPRDAKTWPQFMIDRQATTKSLELSEVAWAQLSGQGKAQVNQEWAGSMDMISSAIIMFFGAVASSAVLFVYGFTLLIYQLTMITAVLMSPFFFLFGIVPNWGRRVLMRYFEILASLAVKRIVTGTLLAFYLIFYNLVVGDANVNTLLLKIIIIAALALFFIFARGKFVKMFADNINFGGNKSVGLPGNKAAAVAAGVGVGVLGGGLIGGAIAGNKMRKMNKDIEGGVKNLKLEGGNPTADIKTPPRGPNSGGSGGGGGGGTGGDSGGGAPSVSPMKIAGKTINAVEDVNRAKNLIQNARNNSAAKQGTPNVAPANAAQGQQTATNASNGATTPSGSAGASQSGTAAQGGSSAGRAMGSTPRISGGGAGQSVAPKAVAEGAGKFVSSGGGAAAKAAGAGTSVAPAAAGGAALGGGTATAGAAASGVISGGAAAGGAAATGGAAAGAGAAAAGGAAATGGAVAAGAAAGSVVPVVGTVIGAGAAAVISAQANKKKSENNEGNND